MYRISEGEYFHTPLRQCYLNINFLINVCKIEYVSGERNKIGISLRSQNFKLSSEILSLLILET